MSNRERQIEERLQAVRARIAAAARACGRNPAGIRLLAVSKTFPAADLRAAQAAGQDCFGESYLNEALPKIAALTDPPPEWHYIGPLQANKTRQIAERFAWVHSLDRLKLGQRLDDQRPKDLPPLNVCLQINISGEASKAGLQPGELGAVAQAVAALPRLRLRGLMAIPAPSADMAEQRVAFRQLRMLLDELNAKGLNMDTLSMGMSDDLEAAIAEGATIVRIGSAIFGARG
ncbi:YggS family pyridoxal phosphate-dependent enzyme [Oceanibaculum nanhaiense]|uniref:YggS family pyridoxal phosphate-dependent enzyme n=1 Tax=Oceanibaculum nanhaiense TaxID=1909734 RepID=UPI00396F12E5